ncbi:MAG: riboflavin biosynthesis protein RibD [Coxiella sp. RIFCSPHIGHO2_12_FULL_42_15]|nr:MAG: riboflavin biosynthesis protein RibD [Coxiella sp. RIFCSPHIGHO2_12_FULL_42_15]
MHETYLKLALEQAQQGKGFCAPNPAVGAIIVKNGAVVGVGHHQKAGTPHAEIHALQAAGNAANGATLYVTLEPCCHYGRTPPCTETMITANLKEVFFAYRDPNPKVNGSGQLALNMAGIHCQQISLDAINDFYQSYHHWTVYKTPWITAKLAISLDGNVAKADGKPVALTGSALQHVTHQQRRYADAILTTIRTVLNDDPQLNVRFPQQDPIAKKVYVLDRELQFSLTAQLLKTAASITLFHEPQANTQRLKTLKHPKIRCESTPVTKTGLDLPSVMKMIGQDGIHDLWVEAGGRLFNTLITEKMAHELYLYIAPKTLGPNALAAFSTELQLSDFYKNIQWCCMGNDIMGHCKN